MLPPEQKVRLDLVLALLQAGVPVQMIVQHATSLQKYVLEGFPLLPCSTGDIGSASICDFSDRRSESQTGQCAS